MSNALKHCIRYSAPHVFVISCRSPLTSICWDEQLQHMRAEHIRPSAQQHAFMLEFYFITAEVWHLHITFRHIASHALFAVSCPTLP
jgi:hypothetical protein